MSRSAPVLSEARLALGRERFKTRDYILHQAVADLFGDRSDRGYLFYELGARQDDRARVLILSRETPANSLSPRAKSRVLAIRSKPFIVNVSPGTPLDFEIRFNATVVRTISEPSKGKGNTSKQRLDVWDAVWGQDRDTPRTPHDVYGDYLQRKLAGAADLLHARVVARERVTMRARRDRKPIFFVATTLIGTLTVTDSSLLTELVAHGIGRAKAFGCGLLCLSPPGSVLPRRYRRSAS